MTPLAQLEWAAAAFVGSHFLLSHPLRRPLVRAIGEKGFLGLYSLVALATFGAMVWAYRRVPAAAPQWTGFNQSDAGIVLVSLLVWFGAVLFAGSLRGNPALPHPEATATRPVRRPAGVFRITRHPMMWGFGLWAIGHAIANPTPQGLVLSEAIGVLALFGAALQDRRKRTDGEWRRWVDQTSFVPFGRGLAGPGWLAFGIGTALFLAATWAHGALGYRPAGPWAFLG